MIEVSAVIIGLLLASIFFERHHAAEQRKELQNMRRKIARARDQRDRAESQRKLMRERYEDRITLLNLPKGVELEAFSYEKIYPYSEVETSHMVEVFIEDPPGLISAAIGRGNSWKEARDSALKLLFAERANQLYMMRGKS